MNLPKTEKFRALQTWNQSKKRGADRRTSGDSGNPRCCSWTASRPPGGVARRHAARVRSWDSEGRRAAWGRSAGCRAAAREFFDGQARLEVMRFLERLKLHAFGMNQRLVEAIVVLRDPWDS
jgi:hypothetical protein